MRLAELLPAARIMIYSCKNKNNNLKRDAIFPIFTEIFAGMAEKSDILFSEYIIDGTSKESTPADMLKECMPAPIWDEFLGKWCGRTGRANSLPAEKQHEPIIDETSDRMPEDFQYDRNRAGEYLTELLRSLPAGGSHSGIINIGHPFSTTRITLAESILEALWKEGHFSLNNIDLNACWQWDTGPVGNMAAFHTSIEAASGYMYDLGVKLTGMEIRETPDRHEVSFKVAGVKDWLPFNDMDEYAMPGTVFTDDRPDLPGDDIAGLSPDDVIRQFSDDGLTETTEEPEEKVWIWNTRKCPERIIYGIQGGSGDNPCDRQTGHGRVQAPDRQAECGKTHDPDRHKETDTLTSESSWLIYIPFDTCSHRLGGSLLSDILGNGNGNGPGIMDPDYFIDCFEVVRELVEDGIVMTGATAGRGGLMTAVARMTGLYGYTGSAGCYTSIDLDISGIEQAYIETDAIRILFSEIPGVVIQIRDSDYDYVDAQFLLQDIAYYPIGHPAASDSPRIRLSSADRTGLSAILAALMDGQSSEGED